MAEIKDYSDTAANNNSTPPDGAPEGQAPSTVNDVMREMMARMKRAVFDTITSDGGITTRSTDAGSAASPENTLYRDSASPAADDELGEVKYDGNDDGGNRTTYARTVGKIKNPADGNETGDYNLKRMLAGSEVNYPLSALVQAPVRQTVLGGPVDANGRADFLAAGTGLAVDSSGVGSSDPLTLAFGDGFAFYGPKDIMAQISSSFTISSLTDDTDPVYLYAEYDPSTGAVTYGHSTLAPEYAYAKPGSPSSGQYWYPVDHRSRGEEYDGSAWQPKLRVYLGECVTASGSVTSVTSYAYQGKYLSVETITPTAGTAIVRNHNIGAATEVRVEAAIVAGGDFYDHKSFRNSFGSTNDRHTSIGKLSSRLSMSFLYGGSNAANANDYLLDRNGTLRGLDEIAEMKFIAERSF